MATQYTSYATNSPRTVIVGDNFSAPETGSIPSQPISDGETYNIKPSKTVRNPILIKMRFFTFLVALTAFVIAGCAAFFSVSGLSALFAGAFWSIVIMGGILEIGKLVATSFLYRYWKHTSFFLKSYLMLAVFILMVITSAGIFGYLSKAHIEQQGNITNAEVIVQRIDSELQREESKIVDLENRIGNIRSSDVDYSQSIARQESIRDSAWDMVQSDIEFEQSQINDIQRILIEQLDSLDNKYELDIQDLNTEQNRIESELKLISDEERGLFSKKQNDLKDSLRQQQSEIVQKKDKLRNKLGNDKQILRDEATSKIRDHQSRISEFREQAQSTIDNANLKINSIREDEELAQDNNVERISELQNQIDNIYSKMDDLNDKKFEAEANVRIVESEVGPVKYVAEAIYGDTEKSTLEKSIRILIIMIVFVFDPLAVALILAYNSLIMMGRTESLVDEEKSSIQKTDNTVSTEESHKENLFKRFLNVKTKNGNIKNLKGENVAETSKK